MHPWLYAMVGHQLRLFYSADENYCKQTQRNVQKPGEEFLEVFVERDQGIYIDSSLQLSKRCFEVDTKGNRV